MDIQKTCKECGKLFHPRNPRQRYCDDIHYRPCPTCGKPVEIKYLTDPTPRCAECRKLGVKLGKKAPMMQPSAAAPTAELEDNLPVDFVERVYTGRDGSCGFIKGHKYLVKVKPNRPYGYIVEAIKDLTANEDVEDVGLPIASANSFYYFFKEA